MPVMHFLIVDDEPMVRRTLKREIETAHPDCTVTQASSAEEALRMLDSKDAPLFADIVISDNSMPPGMKGVEFLRSVRERLPRSIRILVTGDQMESAEVAAMIGSGLLFLCMSKPWDGEALRREIGIAVRRIVEQEAVRFPPSDREPVDCQDAGSVCGCGCDEPNDQPDPFEEWGSED